MGVGWAYNFQVGDGGAQTKQYVKEGCDIIHKKRELWDDQSFRQIFVRKFDCPKVLTSYEIGGNRFVSAIQCHRRSIFQSAFPHCCRQ